MENRENQSPATGSESDLSKVQNQQQPQGQQGQPGEQSDSDPSNSGQAGFGEAGQSDTATQQRSDIEGGTATGQASDSDIEGSSQFVGSQSGSDTSSELIEDDDDFAKDGQGVPE